MVKSTLNRAEAKYNVTTEFPSLGLHYAAASGDVGLVEYALNHGQPVNSVVDGILPLHAASAGGNSQVVQLLIDHGADVNAQRLPRKYSSERNRDTSVPIIGTTASTPLHFAAANGNKEVVNLLLLHGAHADRADKHGVTPEMVAEEHGWLECSSILRQWILNKDRDLREREPLSPADDASSSPNACRSKRLHVKKSMDTALAMLKTADPWRSRETLTKYPEASLLASFPPAPPTDFNGRRPSLPQIVLSATAESEQKQKPPSPVSRPRPPSSDLEQDEHFHPYGRGGAGRRTYDSKYSLMTIFHKAHADEGLDISLASDSLSFHDSPALTSVSIPVNSVSPPHQAPSRSSNSSTPILPETPVHTAVDMPHQSVRSSSQLHSSPTSILSLPQLTSGRLEVEVLSEPQFKNSEVTSLPSNALDLDSLGDDDQAVALTTYKQPRLDELSSGAQPSPSPRPGILKVHNRTGSSHGSPLPRMLRFDSNSSANRRGNDSPRGTSALLRSSPVPNLTSDTTRSPATSVQELPIEGKKPLEPGNDQTESYGQILTGALKLNVTSMLLQRPRRHSFGSPSDAELSPIDSVDDSSIAGLKSEFPFSIEEAPVNLDSGDVSLQEPRYLSVPATLASDKRGRGDSLSSNSTSSENRSNSHTSSSPRGTTISTPGLLSVLASPLLSDRSSDIDPAPPSRDLSPPVITASSSQTTTKSRVPTEIDLSGISSYAAAEALVQQTRRDALDFADNQDFSPLSPGSSHTPLSARLAAYGESLALEKKLRDQKESSDVVLELQTSATLPLPLTFPQRSGDVMERQHSLRERRTVPRHQQPRKDPRRPSTAEGVTSTKQDIFVKGSPASWRTQTLSDIKQNLVLPPLEPRRYPQVETSLQTQHGANTNEGESIEQIIATPVSDPKKSAMKLTRMGYPAEAATIHRNTPSPSSPPSSRFGVLKTLIQTLRKT